MTTISFSPNNASTPPFQAQVTLDGNPYLLAAMWNFYRGNWYVSLTDQNGTVVCNQPLIGSPPTFNNYLFPGIFTTSTMTYDATTETFTVNP